MVMNLHAGLCDFNCYCHLQFENGNDFKRFCFFFIFRYHCKECQRGFVTCSAYNVHLKRHKGQRDYHCECGKTFYTSSALKQHKVVHTGEKKYQCKICERKFSQTSHLSRHFKRDHAKPNMPLPSSDHYKVVLIPEENKAVFGLFDAHPVNPGVKCEGS